MEMTTEDGDMTNPCHNYGDARSYKLSVSVGKCEAYEVEGSVCGQ